MIRTMRAALAVLALGCSPALAQNAFVTPGGAIAPGAAIMCPTASGQMVPCSTPVSAGTGQYGVSIASVTSLTVPSGALAAKICVEGAEARYTDDGVTTPSSTVGIPAEPMTATFNGCFDYDGPLASFKIIGSGATLDVSYYK
jgi:hypothetical protein